MLQYICTESNRYAKQVVSTPKEAKVKTKGGKGWFDITVGELRAWIGVLVYMGVKKLLCMQLLVSKFKVVAL